MKFWQLFRKAWDGSALCLVSAALKNIAFEKTVTVRISFDGWETFSDVEATYIRNAYEGEW